MLELSNISKLFYPGTPDEKVALSGIQLHLKEADFVTVIGSNGAGKSTLMNIISGVMRPDAGQVRIAGNAVEALPEHRRSQWIGRVFQDPMAGTAPTMTIMENMAIAYARNKSRGLSIGVSSRKKAMFREQTLADWDWGWRIESVPRLDFYPAASGKLLVF